MRARAAKLILVVPSLDQTPSSPPSSAAAFLTQASSASQASEARSAITIERLRSAVAGLSEENESLRRKNSASPSFLSLLLAYVLESVYSTATLLMELTAVGD